MGVVVPNFASSTEDRASGAQIVDGGLRFDINKNTFLKRTPSAGNRRTFTLSWWIKRADLSRDFIFSVWDTSSYTDSSNLNFAFTTNTITIETGATTLRVTNALYRDPSAWYHVVFAVDTTQSDSAERFKLYVNGAQVTSFSTNNTVTQNTELAWNNSAYEHNIGKILTSNGSASNNIDGLLSQFYHIDGQALGPEYFGYTDPLTNVWRPKKFKPQATPNDGTVWSSYISGTATNPGSYPLTNIFDDSTSTTGACTVAGGNMTFTPPTPIPYKSSIEIYVSSAVGAGTQGFILNGGSQVNLSGGSWQTVASGSGTLTTLVVNNAGLGNNNVWLSAIRVDGVILLDGDTTNMGKNAFYLPFDGSAPIGHDLSKLNPINNGTTWSANVSASTGTIVDAPLAFNGSTSSGDAYASSTASDTYIYIDFSSPLSGAFKLWTGMASGTPTATVTHSGGTSVINLGSGENSLGTFTSVSRIAVNRGEAATHSFRAISVNGVVLVDNLYGNGWTPVNFGGSTSLEKATGALPILNTDGGGKVARPGVFGSEENKYYTVTTANGSVYQFDITSGDNPSLSFIRGATYKFDYSSFTGHPVLFSSTNPDSSTTAYTDGTSIASNVISFTVPHDAPDTLYYYCQNHPTSMNGSISITTDTKKADPYAWKNVLGLPLVGNANDVSNQINSGSSTKTITTVNAVASYTQSNFYGGSYYFDGSGDYLNTGYSINTSFIQGDYTIEAWVYVTATTEGGGWGITGNQYFGARIQGGNDNFYFSSSSTPSVSMGGLIRNTWNHIAMVKSGTTGYGFVNGVLVGTTTVSSPSISTSNLYVGLYYSTLYTFPGYIQDFRLYSTAKYTSNFIPASTNPDIVPDSPSGVSYSSNLTPVTDGAVYFDGSGDTLSIADSADFDVASGDFTLEGYIYPQKLSSYNIIFDDIDDNRSGIQLSITSSGLYDISVGDGAGNWIFQNNSTVSVIGNAWQHIAITRNGSSFRFFLNGVQQLSTTSATAVGNPKAVTIGGWSSGSNYYFQGFISNFHFVKGTALYTENFTPPTAPITAIENTKLLCCKSNSSATAFDVSPGTITSVNAVATNFNPFTVDIDAQRGKQSGYATMSPLFLPDGHTFTNGNLTVTHSTGVHQAICADFAMSSGKWYWEYVWNSGPSGNVTGIWKTNDYTLDRYIGGRSSSYGYYSADGNKYNNSSASSYGSSFTTGDVIGNAFDADNGILTFYKNGISQGVAYSSIPVGINTSYFPAWSKDTSGTNTTTATTNFGQKPFKFPPPAGFQPLTLANLPRPSIVRPDQYVGIVTYYAADAVAGVATGLSFKPDLVWVKSRTTARSNVIMDSVRGTNSVLWTDLTNGESSSSQYITSFNSNGFSYGVAGDVTNNSNLVGWCWKAGGNSNTFNIDDVGYSTASAAGLTAGTITPTGASVNTKSGFSIIKFTTQSSGNGTVSHGLNTPPYFYITKATGVVNQWWTYHKSLGATKAMRLNTTDAELVTSLWNNTEPTDVISFDANWAGSNELIVYAWAEIPGFSKFGSYTGNNSPDRPFIETGMRPALVVFKKSSASGDPWLVYDGTRNTFNLATNRLFWNNASQEFSSAAYAIDILSNGFKIRTSDTSWNADGATFVYMAWAETPTFNLYGAQANAR